MAPSSWPPKLTHLRIVAKACVDPDSCGAPSPASGRWLFSSDAGILPCTIAHPWEPEGRSVRHWWQAAGLAAGLILLATLWSWDLARPRIIGDGAGYYAPLASVLHDGDLDLRNELQHLNRHYLRAAFATPDGRLGNPFPIGPALVWAPLVWLTKSFPAWSWLDAPLDGRVRSNHPGYAPRYARALLGAQVVSVFLALTVLMGSLQSMFGWWKSALACFAGLVGTPLWFYTISEPSYGHVTTFLAVALYLAAILRDRQRPVPLMILGLALGFVVVARVQDAVLALLLVPRLWEEFNAAREQRKTLARKALLLLVPCVLLASLQWIYWFRLYGEWVFVPPGPDFFPWYQPKILPLLFSTWNGVWLWAPVLLLGFGGLWFVSWKQLRWVLLLAIGCEVYLGSILLDWWGGLSFGPRRMVSLVPLAIVGTTVLLHRLTSWRRWVIVGVVILMTAWTQRLSVYEHARLLPGNPGNAADYQRFHPPQSPATRLYGWWDYRRLFSEIIEAEAVLKRDRRAAKNS